MISCDIHHAPSSEHTSQLFTGFGALARAGVVRLRMLPPCDGPTVGTGLLEVNIGGVRVCYDLTDGPDVNPALLARCALYFKRSLRPGDESKQVRPLGLNYPVYGSGDGATRRALRSLRVAPSHAGFAQLLRSSATMGRLLRLNGGRATSHLEAFEGVPNRTAAPRIVFLARAWDPASVRDDTARKRSHRNSINEMRAGCIRALRSAFGPSFVGGFAPTEYARRHFPDCVASAQSTAKGAYLRLLRGAQVGVATEGLQGSTGWKLAEYVAGAKAIVSEPLRYVVPGGFAAGRNYLEFRTPDDCVDAVARLVLDHEARYAMMEANAAYYRYHLHPAALVLCSIQQVHCSPAIPAAQSLAA